MSPAPVHTACNLVYNLSVLSNIPPSVADTLQDRGALYPLRPLFNIGIHDIDYLSQLDSDAKPQNSWIACTTDDILETKSKLYDVLVELPSRGAVVTGVKQWPHIRTSTGEDIKATQRDLRRYYALKRELNRVQHARRALQNEREDWFHRDRIKGVTRISMFSSKEKQSWQSHLHGHPLPTQVFSGGPLLERKMPYLTTKHVKMQDCWTICLSLLQAGKACEAAGSGLLAKRTRTAMMRDCSLWQ